MIPQTLTNMNLFVDGRSLAGRVNELTLPKLRRKTEENRAGGMDAPVKQAMGMEALEASGSSPQARGTPLKAFLRRLDFRFIPAGAGNTADPSRESGRHAVHPRRRGEHVDPIEERIMATGSSPQARGTPADPLRGGQGWRFIPAGAGNTARTVLCFVRVPVHPRRRGEHRPPATSTSARGGSSPQARGTRHICCRWQA